jgi:uncharacterized membrane protein
MRKILIAFLTISLIQQYIFAQANNPRISESIQSFHVDYSIKKDGTVDVTETLKYQFSESRHGIIRKIPYRKVNQDGKKFNISIGVNEVIDEQNNRYNFKVTDENNYKVIRIGDANKYVDGLKSYVIKYTLSGAITYFTDHDEFYWNITGDEWEIPIYQASANIDIEGYPINDANSEIRIECFTGSRGSNNNECNGSIINNKINIATSKILSSREGFTVAFGFPKNLVSVIEPKSAELNPILKMMLIIFGGVLTVLWYLFLPIKILLDYIKEYSNTKSKQKIVSAWFSPPEDKNKIALRPAEVSVLVNKTISNREITATIIDLAYRGYIKIKHFDKNILFIKKKDIELVKLKSFDDLENFEKKLVDTLFDQKESITISSLTNDTQVYSGIESTKNKIRKELKSKGMFVDDLKKKEDIAIVLGFFASITLNVALAPIAFILGRKSARRTDLGIEKYSEAKSLRNFLESQNEKLDFQAEKQMFFEKLLPYATAFGVEDVWIKKFETLNIKNPDWFEGGTSTRDLYALSAISHSLNNSVATMSSTRSSSGFSSGFSGGSSGGGGGGGGGGSW